jgi:hypothetical protein
VPDTDKLLNIPVLVILGCAAVVSVPVKKLADIKLAPVILPPPAPVVIKLPTVALPDTDMLLAVTLPDAASKTILPVVIPF